MLEHEYGFYPTPQNIIREMLSPYYGELANMRYFNGSGKFILEPSAGKGDILDYLNKFAQVDKKYLLAVEVQPELQAVLTEKGYKLVDTDFLEYGGDDHFNMVLMNPPFHEAEKHILHAWDILPDGDLCAVLNAETLRNPHTHAREMLGRLVRDFSLQEPKFIRDGFTQAERRTKVETAIIWLRKPAQDTLPDFDYTAFEKEGRVSDEEFSASPLAHFDQIETLVARYNAAIRITKEQHKLEKALRFYLADVRDGAQDDRKANVTLQDKLLSIKQDFWKYIFEKTRLGNVVTSDFKKKFTAYRTQTESIAFTVKNIRAVLEMFFENHGLIMQECINQVFDDATKYHEKNVVHHEGWKTNKSYKVARKIIMPRGLRYDPKFDDFDLIYIDTDFYRDLDLIMCMLSGQRIENVKTVTDTLHDHFSGLKQQRWGRGDYQLAWNSAIQSTFFDIRIFKKGTVHLEFRDETLWQNFNVAAAKGKGWRVGSGY